jgi:hypothetical protein
LQAGKIGRAWLADQHRADPALFEQSDPPENERTHHDLADLGRADHQRTHVRRVERKRGTAVRAGGGRRQRLAPGELADLARELAGMVGGDGRLAIETIAADDIDRTLEHEPGRRIGHAGVEHHLAGGEIPGRPASEALGRFDLARLKHRKQLVTTGLNYAHRYSPGGCGGHFSTPGNAAPRDPQPLSLSGTMPDRGMTKDFVARLAVFRRLDAAQPRS